MADTREEQIKKLDAILCTRLIHCYNLSDAIDLYEAGVRVKTTPNVNFTHHPGVEMLSDFVDWMKENKPDTDFNVCMAVADYLQQNPPPSLEAFKKQISEKDRYDDGEPYDTVESFYVIAGKMDMAEINVKHASSFRDFDSAIKDYFDCKGYEFRRLKYKNWIVEIK